VLARLVEICEHDRALRVRVAQPPEKLGEQRLARRRPMKWRVRHDCDLGVGKRGQLGSEPDRAIPGVHERCARMGERIGKLYVVPGGAQNRGRLHRAEIGEVRIIDEVARQLERRKYDRDATLAGA
jgi:hypothetical protein